MTYDIPPPLQHKETILWGLNWNQIAYAAPALLLSLLILIKAELQLAGKMALITTTLSISVFFMFFSGKKRIEDYLTHMKYQHVSVGDHKSNKLIDIQTINDFVHTSNSKLAVLEITPINLLIKDEESQAGIIYSFQKFLNSLDFPIQIHVSTQEIDLEKHLNQLKLDNNRFSELQKDYANFAKKQAKQATNRKFHIIIKETSHLESQVEVCLESLKSLNLKNRQLKNKELFNFYFDYVTNKQQKELGDNQIIKNYTQYQISPSKITFESNSYEVNQKHHTVLAVKGYPQTVEKGFLDKLISSKGDFDISLHIEPFAIDETMLMLNRELQKQQADLHSQSSKGILNPSLDIKFKSTRRVLEDLQKGKQKLFNVSLYIKCSGNTKKEAMLQAKKIKATLDSILIQSKIPSYQMQAAYESMLPLAKDTLQEKRNIHSQGLSAFFPFSSPFLNIDNDGILLGMNKNNVPYVKNIFNLTNANGLVLATSGAGKSYFTKLLISRQHINNTGVIIIDPQAEYVALTQHLKGEVITISKTSKTIINPLDLMGHDYLEKRLSLMSLFNIMLGDLTEVQKAVLDQAVHETYAKKGINTKSKAKKSAPIMSDLVATLKTMSNKAPKQELVTYQALLNRLKMYSKDGVFGFLDRKTNIDFSKDFVCFNIGDMPKQVKPVVMFLVLDFVYTRMKESKKKKLLVVDEAWAMLQGSGESSYIFEIVKTCRKFNLGLLMITQDVADLVSSKAGHAVLANTSYTFLLRQKPAVIRSVVSAFNLSSVEKEYLVTASKGQGLMLLENDHQEITVKSSKVEHQLITTDPNEVFSLVREETVEDVSIDLDTEQDVYDHDSLSVEERLYLESHDYNLGSFRDLENKRQRKYFVKNRRPEGAKHTFYVDLLVKEIRKFTEDVSVYRTERPDIIFTNVAGEEIVIEVETGVGMKKKRRIHDEKFRMVKKEYGNRCWIFLITQKILNGYVRHNLPILTRSKFLEFVKLQFSGKKNTTLVQILDCANENIVCDLQMKGK